MKCDKCGKTIKTDALICPFCKTELKSPTEEVEVLDDEVKEEIEVEETLEPSIVSSEEISIQNLDVEKHKNEENKENEVEEENSNENVQEKIETSSDTEEIAAEELNEANNDEKVSEENTDEVYEPFVESDNIVVLPPKKTIWYRIKDFYNSWFEGYEKMPEIKVDDRETRLTLDKIYEKSSRAAQEKKISSNDVIMVWLACFVAAFIAFFILTVISFIVDIIVGDKNNTSLLTVIIPVFQIGIPVFLIAFGWLIGIVYSYVKRSNRKNNPKNR